MSTKQELQRIRTALAARSRGPGRRLPPDLRERIARYAIRRARDGATRFAVAREVGVGEQTISRAIDALPDELIPIRVAEPARGAEPARSAQPSHGAVVRGPAGLTIEGLDIADIAELIRALS